MRISIRIVLGLIIAALFVFTAIGTSQTLPQSRSTTSGKIELWVRDARTDYSVPAIINVQGQRSLTLHPDDAGRVTTVLPSGEYGILVTAPGYELRKAYLNITPGSNQNLHIMLDSEKPPEEESAITMKAGFRPGFTLLHGYVEADNSGKPLSDTVVCVGDAETRTDVRGHYMLSVPTPPTTESGAPGKATISFAKPGYQTSITEGIEIYGDDMLQSASLERGAGVTRHTAPGLGTGTGVGKSRGGIASGTGISPGSLQVDLLSDGFGDGD